MIFDVFVPFRLVFAGARLAWARFRGFRVLVTPDEQTRRLNECENCDQLTRTRQCQVCKCFVDEKILLTTEKCPLKKWLRIYERNITVD